MNRATMLVVAKRIFRGIVKIIALAAGLVFLFDNRLSDTGLTVLLGSIAVIFVCVLIWCIFDLGDWSEQSCDTPPDNHPGEGNQPNIRSERL